MRRFRILSLFLILMSCSGDVEVPCEPPLFISNIIGSWDVVTSENDQFFSVIFKSDGTGANISEEGPFIYYCHQNEEEIKDFTWRLDTLGNTEYFFLKYRNTNCVQDNGHLILSNECDKIELSEGFEMITLTKS